MRRIAQVGFLVLSQVPLPLSGQVGPTQAVYANPILQIGEVMGDSDEYAFTEIRAMAVVGDSILVLEGMANEVRVFDHEGRFLGRFGRKGRGPGEFRYPTDLRRVSEGIVVSDPLQHRETFFSPDGTLLRTEPLGRLAKQSLARTATMRGGVTVGETLVETGPQGTFPEQLIVLLGAQAPVTDTIARYSSGNVPYWTAKSWGFLGHDPGSEGDWAVAGDSVLVIMSGEPPTLRWWRDAGNGLSLQGDIALPVEPEAFTDDDKDALVDRVNRNRRSHGAPPLPKGTRVEVPHFWGQVKQLVVSDEHKCWIQWDKPRSDDDYEWFVLDLETRDLKSVSLPTGFEMLAAVGNRLYGFVLGDLDTPSLTVYQLRDEGL